MIFVDNNVFYIQIDGDMGLSDLHQLQEQLSGGFDAYGEWDQMTLDLFGAGSLCSASFSYIKMIYKVVSAQDKQFMVIGCSDETLARMKLFRLDTLFPIGIKKSSAELKEEQRKRASKTH